MRNNEKQEKDYILIKTKDKQNFQVPAKIMGLSPKLSINERQTRNWEE